MAKQRNDDGTHPLIKSREGKQVVKDLYHIHRFPEKRIAALFDENQGRVAEIIRAKRASKRSKPLGHD
jgi:hypothetical protein